MQKDESARANFTQTTAASEETVAEQAENSVEQTSEKHNKLRAKWEKLPRGTRKGIFVTAIVLSVLLGLYLLFNLISLGVVAASINDELARWEEWQVRHIAELERAYRDGTAPKINEADFCNFDLQSALDEGMRLNELRYLATHNSYKQSISKETEVFYDYALFGACNGLYDYVFDTVTEQLNNGIRSIEIDLYKHRTADGFDIKILHNCFTEATTSMADFALGLKELKMWSDYNEGHLPIIVLAEPKTSGIGKFAAMDEEAFKYAFSLMENILGDKLYTPSDAIGDYENFAAMRSADDYPKVSDLTGKFVFLLHESKNKDRFTSLDETLLSQKMFYTAYAASLRKGKSGVYADNVLFVLANEPAETRDTDFAAENNFIVRTRIDLYHIVSAKRLSTALASGANIMSSDYPPTTSNRYDYTAYINESGKTIDRIVR